MAQQDCGQCGYLCETYSAAIASGAETKLNLCAPGGKETSRMLKRLLEETPAVAGNAPAQAKAPEIAAKSAEPGSRDAPVEAVFRSATRLNGGKSQKDTRHVVFDIAASGLAYTPGDSFGLYPRNDPALAEAVPARPARTRRVRHRRQALPRRADRGLRAGPGSGCPVRADRAAGGRRPASQGQSARRRRGPRRRCGNARRAGGAREVRSRARRPRSVPGVPGAAAAAPLLDLILAAGDARRGAPDRRCRAL